MGLSGPRSTLQVDWVLLGQIPDRLFLRPGPGQPSPGLTRRVRLSFKTMRRRRRRIFSETGWVMRWTHVPPRFDKSSTYNHPSLFISALSWVISTLSRAIWASICSHTITWMTRGWELEPNYEEPTINTQWLVRISLAITFEIL